MNEDWKRGSELSPAQQAEAEPCVPVIFRMPLKRTGGGVLAVFPTEPEDVAGVYMTCYAHVGQHSGCAYDWYRNHTRPAKPNEYEALKRELEAPPYSYRLELCKKITAKHRAALRAKVRGE